MVHVDPSETCNSFLETALLQADRDHYAGVHETLIRQLAWVRDIPGSATTSPFPSTPYPESAHPYADATDNTQTHTIPGASSLRVVFDPLTRLAHTANTNHDQLYVQDGTGASIPGSPFGGESLQGRTVTVPGDSVRFRLVSAAADRHAAAGYRIASIRAANPANQPPVAAFAPSRASGFAPLRVIFDATASTDPDGTIVVYELDLDDGSETIFLDPAHPVADIVYLSNRRSYFLQTTVLHPTLTVTDDHGNRTSTQLAIRIDPYDMPGDFTALGTGCQTSLGQPLAVEARQVPAVGAPYRLWLGRAPAGAPVLFLTGFSNTTWNGVPLPFSLGVLGAPTCWLLVSTDIVSSTLANPQGEALFTMQIPNNAALRDLHLFHQFAVFDPPANNLGLAFSSAIDVQIGDL